MSMQNIDTLLPQAIAELEVLNRLIAGRRRTDQPTEANRRSHRLQKVLVANRGEIAKRFFLALHEEGIPSVAVVTDPDRGQSWYEFADEVIFIGDAAHYSSIPVIIGAAVMANANALYTGYGFLSENADFVEALENAANSAGREILFMGPRPATMKLMGNKMNARDLARAHGVPLLASSDIITGPRDDRAGTEAERVGYPVIVKLCSGGGGKGMYPVFGEPELRRAVESACRLGRELYNDQSFYLEQFVSRPVHIEVQIFNGAAIGLRKCAVQRRNQKIIEESGHVFLNDGRSKELLAVAEHIAAVSGYHDAGAGTVEFLVDADTGRYSFLEMNTRLQVEYAVTDQSLGIDIAKWQILYYDGRTAEIEDLTVLKGRLGRNDHSIECRIYAEEPENDYRPSPGTILEMDLPTFNGIRCDFGFREGDHILPLYDPLIGKLIAHGPTRREALIRMERALQELYIKGVKTNVNQLLNIVRNDAFIAGDYTNRLLGDNGDFNETDFPSEEEGNDRRGIRQVLFGAFTEYVRALQEQTREFTVIVRMSGIIDAPIDRDIANRFTVDYRGSAYAVEFLAVALDTYHAYVGGRHNGTIILHSINDRSDDLLMVFGSQSFRVRVNRHGDHIELRMKDDANKISYYRMTVTPEGMRPDDGTRTLTAPFQGTFIAFCREGLMPGERVQQGEPLVILSSMKMETTFLAPRTGIILHLIEDGDLSRLQHAVTADGRIIGKSIQEGEVLAVITGEPGEERHDASGEGRAVFSTTFSPMNLVEALFNDDFEDFLRADPASHMGPFLDLLRAAFQGIIHQGGVIERLERSLRVLGEIVDREMLTAGMLTQAGEIIMYYADIKRLFSPALVDDGLSFQEELNSFAGGRGIEFMSASFSALLHSLYDSYGMSQWDSNRELIQLVRPYALYLLKRSHQVVLHRTDMIIRLVHLVAGNDDLPSLLRPSLTLLMEQEQAERDDTLLKFIKNKLAHGWDTAGPSWRSPAVHRVSSSSGGEARASATAGAADRELLTSMLAEATALLSSSAETGPVDGSDSAVWCCPVRPRDGSPAYQLVITAADAGAGPALTAITAALERGIDALVHSCTGPSTVSHWLHLAAAGARVSWVGDGGPGVIGYADLRRLCADAIRSLDRPNRVSLVFDIGLQLPFSTAVRQCRLVCRDSGDGLRVEFHRDDDRNHLYHRPETVTKANQRLYDQDKWPIDAWAAACFDDGSLEEICIAGIDDADADSTGFVNRPVAASIFRGTMAGIPACFYLKDSRVSGGSTGSREGLKYVAAAYLAYRKDWPLYVWNDSAGANILEGVVSLNRGAEGFMMNTLMAERVDDDTLRRYTVHAPDPVLRELFASLDRQFGLDDHAHRQGHRRFQFVAVGIGSSAGLDVYGSSQASIQVLLDSEQSYRVLTGSNVIYSVIGEDISNYDIGGANILGTWTGIVDIVATDKLHLVSVIRQIQGIFCSTRDLPGIDRPSQSPGEGTVNELLVLTESMICEQVDGGLFLPFKESYYAAEALTAGFATLGGRRVMIMGTRTDAGLRSEPAIIKAREVLKTARRTDAHQVIIFGRNWQQSPDYHENISMRPRLDLMQTARGRRSLLRIIIVTHVDGLKCVDMTGTADVVIYRATGSESHADRTFAEKNAAFIVHTLADGFDLARTLIGMADPAGPVPIHVPDGIPSVPANHSVPFDIVDSVILHTVDKGSFIEFYRDMNNPITGPHLITGLARLDGTAVGIIADQPLLKGGGADAWGTEKFRVFTEFLTRNALPVIMLSNSSGFVPGSKQERYRIQAIGADSLDANILGQVPVVSVVLNQNYGGRLIQAFNKFLRPGIVYLACRDAVMAVLGVDAAFDLLYGKKYLRLVEDGQRDRARDLKQGFYESYLDKARAVNDAAETGLIDWIIPAVAELREHLLRGLVEARRRCEDAFGTDERREGGPRFPSL